MIEMICYKSRSVKNKVKKPILISMPLAFIIIFVILVLVMPLD